ncbi:FHA domain-containing protein [Phormidium tenue FACHB-886]|nr:FHA domain-containing protein [Phormidium tenue FACHB-886]
MIVCPNCNHQNPDAATQCEACYTPLPAMTACPNCGASVQTDASFCGQCGFNLQVAPENLENAPLPATISPDFEIPNLPPVEPLVAPEPIAQTPSPYSIASPEPNSPAPLPTESPIVGAQSAPLPDGMEAGLSSSSGSPIPQASEPLAPTSALPPPTVAQAPPVPRPAQNLAGSASISSTQLQTQVARLLHVQTNTPVELPITLTVIHIGKPNDRIPPDVDVSGFPNSEIVSRIHADIRVEGDLYYIEDVGSSNGTYINNAPLPTGNRHKLRAGDRIALGKGDKVTFLFQIT